MIDSDKQLLYEERSRLEKSSESVREHLSRPETVEALRLSIQVIANAIVELYESNPKKEYIFIVGGKSRRLTEKLLGAVVKLLPPEHPAKEAIKKRVRLNDKQNKNLYGENTSKQTGKRKPNIRVLQRLGGKNRELIICDDSLRTGRKAFSILGELQKAGIPTKYIVFAGPKEFSKGSDFLRPEGWQQQLEKVVIGTTQEEAAGVLSDMGELLSSYTNTRHNKNVRTPAKVIPSNLDTLDPKHVAVLRNSNRSMKSLGLAIDSMVRD